MAVNTLTIRFAGICTHFRGVVPGVPHRVVLPDAMAIRFGAAEMTFDGDKVVSYVLMPHFPMLYSDQPVDMAGLMTPDGQLQSRVRIRVMNAIDENVTYLPSYRAVPSVQDYVTDYAYSEEVVAGYRATAYFDVFGGVISSEQRPNQPNRVVIQIDTDGEPVLAVEPFRSAAPSMKAATVTLPLGTNLVISNLEANPSDDDPPFDFLLHYLTARGGLPRFITRPMPGMGDRPASLGSDEVRAILDRLAPVVASGGSAPTATARSVVPDDLTPSCSDSRYP